MEVFTGHRALARRLREPAVAIGNFDGVHRGHQRLFEEIRRRAALRGAESVTLTFEPHPARLFAPELAPPLICTLPCKLARIADADVDACVIERFDRAFAALSPIEFVDEVLVAALGARDIVIGHDFTFGRGRAGDTTLLAELGRTRGFEVHVIEPVTIEGMVCSSTRIRELVREGQVEVAARFLGRDPEVIGVVQKGAGRGRSIGVPTANLRPATELLPLPGVYAGWAMAAPHAEVALDLDAQASPFAVAPLSTARGATRWKAAINVGTNPTFGAGSALTVEAHLLDYPGEDLYGSPLVLGFGRRLRAERRFSSVEALVAQIKDDIAAAAAETAGAATTSGPQGS